MKKIITFLGTNNYEEIIYTYTNEEGKEFEVKTRLVQEAISEIVGKDAIIYVCLTDRARETNWIDRIEVKVDRKTGEKREDFYYGLKPRLERKNIKYEELPLRDGANNEEMWENFGRIFDIFEEGDEVYFDVTHSFRSIPFIVMSVLNYAKFIKNIEIKSIYYGAFEAMKDGKAPIFNLSIFNQITDWTIGAERFISTGDSKQLSNMIETTIQPILRKQNKDKGDKDDEEARVVNRIRSSLKNFSEGLYTVRGSKTSNYGTTLKKALESIKEINIDELKPFEKILDKIYEKVHFYSNDIILDVHNTVKLCRDLNLIQQAYTYLQENIISYLCVKANMDLYDEDLRMDISRVIPHYRSHDRLELSQELLELNERLKPYISSDLADLYKDLGDFRNDINHGGYRKNPRRYSTFYENLDDFILKFESIVFNANASNN